MTYANIKISSDKIKVLKTVTGESTGQKAVQKALAYFLREAKQRNMLQVLDKISFQENFNPLELRKNER